MMDVKKTSTTNSSSTGGSTSIDPTSPPPPTTTLHPFLMHQFLQAQNSSAAGSTMTTTTNTTTTTTTTTNNNNQTSSTVNTAAQLLQNYALVATSAANNSSSSGDVSSSFNTNASQQSTSGHTFWDSSSFTGGSNGLVTSVNNSNEQSFANAASQLLATISAQMVKESKIPKPSSGSRLSSVEEKLFCLMCGQTTRDPMEYEQHLLLHFSMLDPGNNQKIYQHGMHFLQMQNLLNSGNNSPQMTSPMKACNSISSSPPNDANVTNGASSSTSSTTSTITTTTNTSVMTKKRKLLSSHHAAQQNNEVSVVSVIESNTNASSEQTNGNEPEHSTRSITNISQSSTSASAAAFPCTSCHKTFATEVDLKAHLIRHLTQHPFVCFSCGKGFKYEHSLNFHVKSYHSGAGNSSNSGSSSKNSNEKNPSSSKFKDSTKGSAIESNPIDNQQHQDNHHQQQQQQTSSLKLKRKCSSSEQEKKSKQAPSENLSLNDQIKSPTGFGIMAPTLITDENHNQTTTRSFNWSQADLTYFYGKPPTNFPADSPIQIRSEKILISILDAVNVATEQSLLFYKCCLCCVAFPSMDQMSMHVQQVHHLMMNGSELSASVGLLSPNSDQQKQQNAVAATAAAAAAMTALLAKSAASAMDSHQDPKLSSPTTTTTTTSSSVSSTTGYQCDKCLAKFTESIEYEIHSQLHRTLEMAAASPAGLHPNPLAAANQYQQFQLLNSLMIANPNTAVTKTSTNQQSNNSNSSNPTVVDFRKILANASKNTDFGRKFAAHLMDGPRHQTASPTPPSKDKQLTGNSGDNNFPPIASSHDRCSTPPPPVIPMIPSIISSTASSGNPVVSGSGKLNSSDNNNNSLLYLSGIVPGMVAHPLGHHHQSKSFQPVSSKSSLDAINLLDKCSSQSSNKSSSTANKLSLNGLKNSGSSSSSSSTSGGSLISSRHIKEPVDIFEGAGQSLPIQKFPLGDIEETAPGQFKCRFCDKTFDRVFSVHRHERVHTGFKPCVCKTCGRGFSEKRNLRHHIIRFHSDGSGRELLKRKRKPKNSSSGFDGNSSGNNMQQQQDTAIQMMIQQKQQSPLLINGPSDKLSSSAFMSSLLSSAAGSLLANAFQFNNGNSNGSIAPPESSNGSLSNLKLSLAELNRINTNKSSATSFRGRKQQQSEDGSLSGDEDLNLTLKIPNNRNLSNETILNLSSTTAITSSLVGSSRRRKSKPSKKVVSQDDDETEDQQNPDDEEQQDQTFNEQNKGEIVIAGVDVHSMTDDRKDDVRQAKDKNKRSTELGQEQGQNNNKQLTKDDLEPDDGEETEEEEQGAVKDSIDNNKDEVNSDTEPEVEQDDEKKQKNSDNNNKKTTKYPRSKTVTNSKIKQTISINKNHHSRRTTNSNRALRRSSTAS